MQKKTIIQYLVPFTGDVNFSESEVVDRLIEIYDEVEIIPGISSTQVAASRAKVPTRQIQSNYNAYFNIN